MNHPKYSSTNNGIIESRGDGEFAYWDEAQIIALADDQECTDVPPVAILTVSDGDVTDCSCGDVRNCIHAAHLAESSDLSDWIDEHGQCVEPRSFAMANGWEAN